MNQTPEKPKIRIKSISERAEAQRADFQKIKAMLGENSISAVELEKNTVDWKDYVDGFSDQELLDGQKKTGEKLDLTKLNRTADSFGVNPEDYPIFDRQGVKITDSISERWNIDKTLSEFVKFTHDTISAMDGRKEGVPKTDEAIYLDKSARPVEKLVAAFWDDFAIKDPNTDKPVEMPHASFLNIDRLTWFRRVGINVTDDMYLTGNDGKQRKATIKDFKQAAINDGGLKKEDLAAIRALYIEGGRTTDDIDEIMRTKTKLDGKNITIIDEVSDTGSTPQITKMLIEAAFPEAKSVQIHVFSDFGTIMVDDTRQMAGSPCWYPGDHNYEFGRGVLDLHPQYWDDVYEKNPTPENYAKKKANFIVSAEMDFDKEPFQESRELFREISQMADDYRAGKILFHTLNWDDEAYINLLRQGVNPENRAEIAKKISDRAPSTGYSSKFPPHFAKR